MRAVARGSAVVELRADGVLAGQLVGGFVSQVGGCKNFLHAGKCFNGAVGNFPYMRYSA